MVKGKDTAADLMLNMRKPQDFSFLFIAINAKYVHTNLAIRYLCKSSPVPGQIREYSINDNPKTIAGEIYKTGEKNILFSCYIWNIEIVLKVCEILKKADKNIITVLGGPEVSFEPEKLLMTYKYVDFIICGEGERLIGKLAEIIKSGEKEPRILKNNEPINMNALPFPYDGEDLSVLKDRIIYYETSRGCPCCCAFCLSGSENGVRFLETERVFKELDIFTSAKVRLVKLVDRTFNADSRRALAIVEHIKKTSKNTTFHFEITADLMTEELTHALTTAPRGMFQVEIGVQSTDEGTLLAINRRMDFGKLASVVTELRRNNNIHIHLDLIAGLPGEDIKSFIKSFNDVLKLRPHELQLGFLKKLSGAPLKAQGSEFSSFPSYEIIKTDKMSYCELLRLKDAKDVLEKYYNSGAFINTMGYILSTYFGDAPFDFFDLLGSYFAGSLLGPFSQKSLFEILNIYCKECFDDEVITEKLIFDYCLRSRDNLSFMKYDKGLKERAFEFLKDTKNIEKYFGCHTDIKPAELYKKLRFVNIGTKIYVFDYIFGGGFEVTDDMPRLPHLSKG